MRRPPRSLIQREAPRWHCAARREITERSEEAPEAKAAQPSPTCGNWKTPAGCFGGDARGAEKGAQPHNRPRLAHAGGGQAKNKRKTPCPQGTKTIFQRTSPALLFFQSANPKCTTPAFQKVSPILFSLKPCSKSSSTPTPCARSSNTSKFQKQATPTPRLRSTLTQRNVNALSAPSF